MECVNLLETFGDKYVIAFDEAYSPGNVPRTKLDPWMMTLPCEGKGVSVYPYGGTTVAVEVNRRPSIASRLTGLEGVKLHQDGNTEKTFLFDVTLFEAVAAIVKPKRQRVLSEKQLQTLARHAFRCREDAQKSTLEQSQTPEADSGPALAG